MTIPSEINRSGPYSCNGATTSFPYAFKIYDETHICVVLTNSAGVETTLTLGTHYTVSGVGVDGGGAVVTVATYATGNQITMILNVPFTQNVDLENQGAYFAETVERAIDIQTQQSLQLKERINRAILLPVGETKSVTISAETINDIAANADLVAQYKDEAAASAVDAAASAAAAALWDPSIYSTTAQIQAWFKSDGTPEAPVKFDGNGAISPVRISANFIKSTSVGKNADAKIRLDAETGYTAGVDFYSSGTFKFNVYLAPDGTFGVYNATLNGYVWYVNPATNIVDFATTPTVVGNPITAFSKSWESAEIALVQGGAFSVFHTLGVAPKFVQAFLVCKTAENGYAVGQIVPVPAFYQYNGGHNGLGLDLSSTTVIAGRFASAGLPFTGINPSNGGNFNFTLANWCLILRAYA